ncbi:MAG: NAD-dependent epimerase/dehydratase family protein, partial [Alphaproteobacteria bacterium]
MNNKIKTYLVLGSAGMLGQALCCELKAKRQKVITIDKKEADFKIDVTDAANLLKTLEEINP